MFDARRFLINFFPSLSFSVKPLSVPIAKSSIGEFEFDHASHI
jgi:hypothetical protein